MFPLLLMFITFPVANSGSYLLTLMHMSAHSCFSVLSFSRELETDRCAVKPQACAESTISSSAWCSVNTNSLRSHGTWAFPGSLQHSYCLLFLQITAMQERRKCKKRDPMAMDHSGNCGIFKNNPPNLHRHIFPVSLIGLSELNRNWNTNSLTLYQWVESKYGFLRPVFYSMPSQLNFKKQAFL